MKEVLIKINKDVNLIITGQYFKSEYETNLPETFEIDKIGSVEEDLFNLMNWVSCQDDYIVELERLCIEKINE